MSDLLKRLDLAMEDFPDITEHPHNLLSDSFNEIVRLNDESAALRQQLDQAQALLDQFKNATMKAEQNGYGQDSVHHDDSWIDELGAALDEAQRLRGEANND